MVAEDGPSSAEEENEATRQRSASATPRSATGTLPHDYDGVMGVASVGSQESVRFGEEDDSEFKEVEEMATHSLNVPDETKTNKDQPPDVSTKSGDFRGGYGSASLKECLERMASENREPRHQDATTSAALHFGEGTGAGSPHSTNPPQIQPILGRFWAVPWSGPSGPKTATFSKQFGGVWGLGGFWAKAASQQGRFLGFLLHVSAKEGNSLTKHGFCHSAHLRHPKKGLNATTGKLAFSLGSRACSYCFWCVRFQNRQHLS